MALSKTSICVHSGCPLVTRKSFDTHPGARLWNFDSAGPAIRRNDPLPSAVLPRGSRVGRARKKSASANSKKEGKPIVVSQLSQRVVHWAAPDQYRRQLQFLSGWLLRDHRSG